MTSSKDKKEKCPVTLDTLRHNYDTAYSNYNKVFRRLKILDAADRSRLWQAISARFPKWQLQPDSNWVSYIKDNLVASIYTVTKGASIVPTSDSDRGIIENLNIALDYIWDTCNVGYYQLQAGDNAALFNIGITQIGWDPDKDSYIGNTYYKGDCVLEDINPLNYMRDPFAKDLDHAAYVMTFANWHKTAILGDKRYHDTFQAYLNNQRAQEATTADIPDLVSPFTDVDKNRARLDTDYYKIVTHFVKYNDPKTGAIKIAEVHTLNNDLILWYKDEIKPNMFPFVELYCNLPKNDLIGTSPCARILSNNIAYNIVNSLMLTGVYKAYHPVKFISSASGLNVRSFSVNGDKPDTMFVVNGDASRAVHYLEQPQLNPSELTAQGSLINDIQTTSGVDPRYTGRDTGSVLTTGGVEDMLDRVTVIDTPKIKNYEQYTKGITRLILANFVEFSMKRTYFTKNPVSGEYTNHVVDYKALANKTVFHYAVNISSELPKNKQRIASVANTLMEKQMQYGANGNGPDLITPEEWLQLQDLPFKELMQKRMGIQRIGDETAKFTKGLFDYASLVGHGTDPNSAVEMIGENMAANATGKDGPFEIPAMDDLVAQEAEPTEPGAAAVDPMQALQQDPTALLQQNAKLPINAQDVELDPELLSALGELQ